MNARMAAKTLGVERSVVGVSFSTGDIPSEERNSRKDASQRTCTSFAALDRALCGQTEQHCPENSLDVVDDHVRLQGPPPA